MGLGNERDGYPNAWPLCSCGRPVLDGHLTCGRIECDESGARWRAREMLRPEDVAALEDVLNRRRAAAGDDD